MEQETVITFNRLEGFAEVYTFEPTLKNKLNKLSDINDDITIKVKDNGIGGATYIIPKKLVSIRKPICKRQAK
ncbi:MAG: immunoglobulin [Eubacteriaceae bacterium]|jgi:hypothetical protein|nr:immunoglobulin [Eubacteriaceae bacterium]